MNICGTTLNPELKLITNAEINRQKWDAVLLSHPDPFPYSLSWYLDVVCPQWQAIINDDYSIMIPLPAKKKYGQNYLVQPLYTQQLTWTGYTKDNHPSIEKIIRNHFSWSRFNINQSAYFERMRTRTNYERNTSDGYDSIRQGYHAQIKRHLKKYEAESIRFEAEASIQKLLDHRHAEGSPVGYKVSAAETEMLKLLAERAFAKSAGEGHYCYVNNRLVSSAFLVKSGNRQVFLASTRSEEGALSLILDHLLKQASIAAALFDFEGSEIPGLARFYAGFGAKSRLYYRVETEPVNLLLKYFFRKKSGL